MYSNGKGLETIYGTVETRDIIYSSLRNLRKLNLQSNFYANCRQKLSKKGNTILSALIGINILVLRVSGHVERDVSVLMLVKGLTRVGQKGLMLLLRGRGQTE